MPQVVAAAAVTFFTGAGGATAASLAGAWGAGVGVAAIYASTYVATSFAIGAGIGALGRAVAPKLPGGMLTSGSPLQMGRDPVASRRVIYGQTRVGGTMVYAQTTGTKNEYLQLVIALAGHECEEIGDIYFADEVVPLDGSGNATGTYAGLARVLKHLGADSQTADATLVAESGGLWTANHRLRGVAYVYVRLKWDQTKFPGGIPNITAVVKGRKCYDPRDTLTSWTANSTLCKRDYLTNTTFGLGVDAATELDDASFIASANINDEDVALAAGGTEKRGELNGSFDLSAEPATVLEKMCATDAGWLVYAGGKWICQAGAHEAPTAAPLTEDDLRGPISVQTKLSMRDTCNRVKGTFISPADKWQPADVTAITNATYLSEDGGKEIWRDLQLDFVTSHSQGQRLLKIELERTRQDIAARVPCKLTAMRFRAGSVLEFTYAPFGWTNKLFIVTGWKFAVHNGGGAPALGVDLDLRETAAAVWDWNSGEETTYDPAPNTTLKDARTVAVPTSLVLTSGATTVQIQPDGTVVPRLKLTWTAPDDQAVISGGLNRIQYKKAADSDWIEGGTVKGDQVFAFILDVLIGVAYDVRLRAENNFGAESAWVTPAAGAHTVVGDVTAPSAVSSLSVTAYAGYNEVKWTGSASADISEYKIFRHTVDDAGAATEIGEIDGTKFRDPTATPGVPYWYYVAAVDGSENVGTRTLAGTVTTAAVPATDVVPTDPTAATKTSETTYTTGDGTVLAKLLFTIPALPANARWQVVRLRKSDNTEWGTPVGYFENAAQLTDVPFDDLSPGVIYAIGTQAFSSHGRASNIVVATGSPFTAPGKTAASANPTSVTPHAPSTTYPATPAYFGTGTQKYSSVITFVDSADKDVVAYEFGVNVNAGVNPAGGGGFTFASVPYGVGQVQYDTSLLVPQYLWYRAKNTSGVWSTWTDSGYNLNSYTGLPAGTMSQQDATDVSITSEKLGNGASVRATKTRWVSTESVTVTGGAGVKSEDFAINISNRGFSAKPDAGLIQVSGASVAADLRDVLALYVYDHGSNTASTAYVTVFRKDGGDLTAGDLRLSIEFLEY